MSDIGPRRISALIAEDEALFRDALVSMLHEQWPELDVVAICEDGAAALDAINGAMTPACSPPMPPQTRSCCLRWTAARHSASC